MAKRGGEGGGGRDGNALKTAVIVAGGLALAWVTVETAFRPFLDRLRAAVSRNTDPARDPDQEDPAPAAAAEEEEKAPAPAEPSAPPVPAEVEGKVAEKVAELEEKVEEAAAAAAADKAE
uniref:Outer envelope membrane protein 7 n=1 Tax=Arundo donax TaxID=35708 RepID=A0A0A9GHY4_ARUDO